MAEAASEALEEVAERQAGRWRITIDARHDFASLIPRRVMTFVLVNLLTAASNHDPGDGSAIISVLLARGAEFNEVRIKAAAPARWATRPKGVREQNAIDRVNRAALWAFGGELLFSSDMATAVTVTTIRLPAPDVGVAARPNA